MEDNMSGYNAIMGSNSLRDNVFPHCSVMVKAFWWSDLPSKDDAPTPTNDMLKETWWHNHYTASQGTNATIKLNELQSWHYNDYIWKVGYITT